MDTENRSAGSDPAGALVERLFQDALGALELYTVYLGDRLQPFGAPGVIYQNIDFASFGGYGFYSIFD